MQWIHMSKSEHKREWKDFRRKKQPHLYYFLISSERERERKRGQKALVLASNGKSSCQMRMEACEPRRRQRVARSLMATQAFCFQILPPSLGCCMNGSGKLDLESAVSQDRSLGFLRMTELFRRQISLFLKSKNKKERSLNGAESS